MEGGVLPGRLGCRPVAWLVLLKSDGTVQEQVGSDLQLFGNLETSSCTSRPLTTLNVNRDGDAAVDLGQHSAEQPGKESGHIHQSVANIKSELLSAETNMQKRI